MIKYIIFDVGGILFQGGKQLAVDIARDILGEMTDEGEKEYISYRSLLQTGRKTTREFFAYLIKKYSLKKTVDEIYFQWLSVYKANAVLNPEITELIQQLKKYYTVVGFSNTIDLHGEYNKQAGNFSLLDKIFLTYEMGFRKPDREAYEFVLDFLKAKPEECIFIDDREENIAEAENLGIKTILFTSNLQLKKELKELKLL